MQTLHSKIVELLVNANIDEQTVWRVAGEIEDIVKFTGAVESVQDEVKDWVAAQPFANQTLDMVALGVIEEVGEFAAGHIFTSGVHRYESSETVTLAIAGWVGVIARSQLKPAQGIRFDAASGLAMRQDAVVAISQLLQMLIVGNNDANRDATAELWKGTDVADGPSFPPAEGPPSTEISDAITYMCEYGNRTGRHVGADLLVRWAGVSNRNWLLYPKDGGEHTEAMEEIE